MGGRRPLVVPRGAERPHQALQRPVAGVGQLHAVVAVQRRPEAAERPASGDDPARRRLRRRVDARRDRPASPRGAQRRLPGRPRLPGERHLLLRLRRALRHDLRRRSARSSRAPSTSRACVRTARSCRATTSWATRSTAWTCGCSSASRSAAAPRSTASSRYSTCSTAGTTAPYTTDEASPQYRPADAEHQPVLYAARGAARVPRRTSDAATSFDSRRSNVPACGPFVSFSVPRLERFVRSNDATPDTHVPNDSNVRTTSSCPASPAQAELQPR